MVNNAILSAVTWVAALRDAVAMRLTDESGQGILEYAVLVSFIGLAAAAAFLVFDAGAILEAFAANVLNCIEMNDECGVLGD